MTLEQALAAALCKVLGRDEWYGLTPDDAAYQASRLRRRLRASGFVLVPVGDLRALSEAATPGPWVPLTHGTASQLDAAGRAFEAVACRRSPDSPEIEFTDLSWVDLSDGRHVALVGNGPNGPENSKFIVACVAAIRDALGGEG